MCRWCPEATGIIERRLRKQNRPPLLLSREAEVSILQAATEHFEAQEPEPEKLEGAPYVLSIIYEERGHFYSRVVHKDEIFPL